MSLQCSRRSTIGRAGTRREASGAHASGKADGFLPYPSRAPRAPLARPILLKRLLCKLLQFKQAKKGVLQWRRSRFPQLPSCPMVSTFGTNSSFIDREVLLSKIIKTWPVYRRIMLLFRFSNLYKHARSSLALILDGYGE